MQRLEKQFNNFKEGLSELMEVSFSAKQALKMCGPNPLEMEYPEEQAVANLAINVITDRPTGNGVDWGRAYIDIDAWGVDYRTTGGLHFGWYVYSDDFQPALESDGHNRYTFWVSHPSGKFTEDSTLLKTGKKFGWRLEN